MKKKPRGTYDYVSNGRVIIVKWKDNQVVTIPLYSPWVCAIIYHRKLLQTGTKTNSSISSESFSRIQ